MVYTELRCKLARLQVQVKELQEEQQVWLQYKNEGSIKDQQKIQKLEKDIALTQRTFQEISGVCFLSSTPFRTQILIMFKY